MHQIHEVSRHTESRLVQFCQSSYEDSARAKARVCLLWTSEEPSLSLPRQDAQINKAEWEALQAYANNFLRSKNERDWQRFSHYYNKLGGNPELSLDEVQSPIPASENRRRLEELRLAKTINLSVEEAEAQVRASCCFELPDKSQLLEPLVYDITVQFGKECEKNQAASKFSIAWPPLLLERIHSYLDNNPQARTTFVWGTLLAFLSTQVAAVASNEPGITPLAKELYVIVTQTLIERLSELGYKVEEDGVSLILSWDEPMKETVYRAR